MMRHSESLAALAPALVAATTELQHATKDADNPFYRSRYASLETVIDATRPIFWKHGLTVIQGPGFEAGGGWAHETANSDGEAAEQKAVGTITVTTMILHESGEWVSSTAGCPISRPDPQGAGGAISYLRRYALAAMAGIGQEDDDANAASTPAHRRAPTGARSSSSGPSKEAAEDMIDCPVCSGPMWDNREDKRSPKAPDLKCKSKECDSAIWLGTWASDTRKRIAAAVEAGVLTAELGAQVEKRIEGKSPAQLLKANEWLDGLATEQAA